MYQKVKLTDCLIFILAVSCLHSQSSGQEIQRSHRYREDNEVRSVNTSHTKHKVTNKDITGFRHDHQRAVVNVHNEFRAMEENSDIRRMHWSDILAESSQRHANSCVFQHTPKTYRGDFPIFRMIGENLYAHSGHFDPEEAVRFWWNEIEYYNYEDNSCSRNCLHYTQVVWANSYAVGCGVKFCPKLKQFKYGQGFFVVCQYGPAGNVIGQKPFKRGSRCSECPAEANTCLDKLCVRSPRADRLRYSTNSSIDRLWTWWQLMTVFGCCVLMNRNFHI